jgi:glycogen(starch) synthase
MSASTTTTTNTTLSSTSTTDKTLLVECAWEVCNQIGGIYTVIRTKVPSVVKTWGDNYLALGPLLSDQVLGEFEPVAPDGSIYSDTVQEMQAMGLEVILGRWLISGNPYVVLLNPFQMMDKLGDIKYFLYDHHGISSPAYDDKLFDQVVTFGEMVRLFYQVLSRKAAERDHRVVAHFHEWMAGSAIPAIRRENLPVRIVFTTHATLLGRYVAMNDPYFYDHLPFMDWAKEAAQYNAVSQVLIERACAHGAHVFTTVSEVTARECTQFLGRVPDLLLPNGLNVERFTALHEFQNLHKLYKDKINEFVMGHFFQSYSFNLDNTLYFFTSGRYEYRNKGFDITTEALARLNHKLKSSGSDTTVVMFFVTKRAVHTIDPDILQSRALMQEIRGTVEAMKEQIGDRLFMHVASQGEITLPPLNQFVDQYWQMRLRRTLQSWRTKRLPNMITHHLKEPLQDELLQKLVSTGLHNYPSDRVKVVYHPDFIATTSPLFGMDYTQFVRGCHLGVFPSYYEPWGYTPMECVASGVPTITSDLTGFGDFVMKEMENHAENGIMIVQRTAKSFEVAAEDLAEQLFQFCQQSRRERITQRNRVERCSDMFDWRSLVRYYQAAYDMAVAI